MNRLAAATAIDANAACRGGHQIDLGTGGSGVPCPLYFPQRQGVWDGQKHLPDLYTPATTSGYPGATNSQIDEKQKASDCET